MDVPGCELRASRRVMEIAEVLFGGVRFWQGLLSRNAMAELWRVRDTTSLRNNDSLGRRRVGWCFEESFPLLSHGGLDDSTFRRLISATWRSKGLRVLQSS